MQLRCTLSFASKVLKATRVPNIRYRYVMICAYPGCSGKDPKMDTALTSRRIELGDPAEAMEFFYPQGWTDGLPVVPPTPKRVGELLEYARDLPGDILGMIPARNRSITAVTVPVTAL